MNNARHIHYIFFKLAKKTSPLGKQKLKEEENVCVVLFIILKTTMYISKTEYFYKANQIKKIKTSVLDF